MIVDEKLLEQICRRNDGARGVLVWAGLLFTATQAASAQTCVGTPLGDRGIAVELHYQRVWVQSGLGGSVGVDLPGAWSARASYTRTGRERHAGGGRVVWEVPNISFSACPATGVTYSRSPTASTVNTAMGLGIGSTSRLGTESRLLLFAFPHVQHSRVKVRSTSTRPEELRQTTDLASEFGFRVAGESFYGGASTTLLTADQARPYFTLVAGIRTGIEVKDSARSIGTAMRDRYGFSVGVIWADPGDHPDTQCGAGPGLAAGAEIRTRGVWLLSTGLDVLANWAPTCTLVLILRTYEGQEVAVSSTPWLAGPRLSMKVGRAFRSGSMVIEPAVGGGLIHVLTGDPGDSARSFWSQWLGGTLTLRTTTSTKAIQVEYGIRQVPFGYYDGSEKVHEFSEREPLLRLVFEF